MDLLYQAAAAWNELINYRYLFTFGYKRQLSTIHLSFSPEEFAHLAGFQYMKGISIPNYSSARIINRILEGKLTTHIVQKAQKYDSHIKPRLLALIHLQESLEDEFSLYAYMPRMYPFYTSIKADYLIASHLTSTDYVFIIRANTSGNAEYNFLCCSTFQQGQRDYTINQRPRILLKKERIYIPSGATSVLYDRLSAQQSSSL